MLENIMYVTMIIAFVVYWAKSNKVNKLLIKAGKELIKQNELLEKKCELLENIFAKQYEEVKRKYAAKDEDAGLDFGAGKEYNNPRENNNEEDGTMRDIMILCEKHPEKAQIFSLVKMLTEAGHPFHFNFYEDLKPTPFGQEGNPETDIDWEHYHFLVEIGEPVEPGLSEISVCFNQDPECDQSLLELVDAQKAPKEFMQHYDLTAEEAMEYIEDFFKAE